jgi:hypothetical protein
MIHILHRRQRSADPLDDGTRPKSDMFVIIITPRYCYDVSS